MTRLALAELRAPIDATCGRCSSPGPDPSRPGPRGRLVCSTCAPWIERNHPDDHDHRPDHGPGRQPLGHPRKTGAEWKAACRAQAARLSGYTSSSPIWGKTDVIVLAEIEGILTGSLAADTRIESALVLVKELQRREAKKRLTATL